MAQIISGKETAAKIRERLRAQIDQLRQKGYPPGLAVVIVGDDPASQVYVRNKEKACKEVGIAAQTFALPKETTQQELMALIDTLNARSDVHGILVQLPLPRHLDEHQVINAILPEKDVDAFHPVNVGKIMIGDFDYVPCTPAGVMALLEEAQIDVSGKRAVVIGRSNIVGKPQAMLLLHKKRDGDDLSLQKHSIWKKSHGKRILLWLRLAKRTFCAVIWSKTVWWSLMSA